MMQTNKYICMLPVSLYTNLSQWKNIKKININNIYRNKHVPRDLFMASHIILVRKAPLLPIRAPTTVSRGWSRIKPSAHRAQPVLEE